jgi:hypothetical protein
MAKGGNDSDRWCISPYYYFNTFVDLSNDDFGNLATKKAGIEPVDLPYGERVQDYSAPNYSEPNYLAITGGSAAAAGVVILVLFGVAFKRWIWPSWKDRFNAKLLEILTKDDRLPGEFLDRIVLQEDEDHEHKLEDTSMHTFDPDEEVEGQDKILVTEDMEEAHVDVSIAYTAEVGLETHPRPPFVTILSGDNEGSRLSQNRRSKSEEAPAISNPSQLAATAVRTAGGSQALEDERLVILTDEEYTQEDALAGEISRCNGNTSNHNSVVPP